MQILRSRRAAWNRVLTWWFAHRQVGSCSHLTGDAIGQWAALVNGERGKANLHRLLPEIFLRHAAQA